MGQLTERGLPTRRLGGASFSLCRLGAVRPREKGWQEPYELRGSCTVLGGTGGEIPPVYSTRKLCGWMQTEDCNWIRSEPHAKYEPGCIDPFNEQFIESHDQNKGARADNQVFQRNGDTSRYNVPTHEQDYSLVENVEGEDRLVGVGECLVVEIQVLCSKAKDKDDQAPAGNAPHDLKENVYPREGLTEQGVVS